MDQFYASLLEENRDQTMLAIMAMWKPFTPLRPRHIQIFDFNSFKKISPNIIHDLVHFFSRPQRYPFCKWEILLKRENYSPGRFC